MLIAVAIGVVLILVVVSIMRGKEKPEIIEDDYIPVYDDDLAYLKVFYKHNELKSGEVITTYDTYSCFRVEGYNLKGYRKVLYPEKVSWKCPCGVVKFDSETGLENCIRCKTKGDYKRSISVRYKNGVSFSFKMVFK